MSPSSRPPRLSRSARPSSKIWKSQIESEVRNAYFDLDAASSRVDLARQNLR